MAEPNWQNSHLPQQKATKMQKEKK
ncbi:UNVERIFIED_CONTAM: hypothetical protein GTU68_036692 [Idotea baltica]|nr:hypothetical protein [Idotea baltica]